MRKKAFMKVRNLIFRVRILDERRVYGRHEWKVTPFTGSGEAWVTKENLTEGKEDGN